MIRILSGIHSSEAENLLIPQDWLSTNVRISNLFQSKRGFLVLAFAGALAVALAPDGVFDPAVGFGVQSGGQGFTTQRPPVPVGIEADLPHTAVKAEERAVVVVIVRTTDDDIDPHSGIENEFHAMDVFATMPVCGRVSGRAVPASGNPTPVNHLFRTRGRHEQDTGGCDDK